MAGVLDRFSDGTTEATKSMTKAFGQITKLYYEPRNFILRTWDKRVKKPLNRVTRFAGRSELKHLSGFFHNADAVSGSIATYRQAYGNVLVEALKGAKYDDGSAVDEKRVLETLISSSAEKSFKNARDIQIYATDKSYKQRHLLKGRKTWAMIALYSVQRELQQDTGLGVVLPYRISIALAEGDNRSGGTTSNELFANNRARAGLASIVPSALDTDIYEYKPKRTDLDRAYVFPSFESFIGGMAAFPTKLSDITPELQARFSDKSSKQRILELCENVPPELVSILKRFDMQPSVQYKIVESAQRIYGSLLEADLGGMGKDFTNEQLKADINTHSASPTRKEARAKAKTTWVTAPWIKDKDARLALVKTLGYETKQSAGSSKTNLEEETQVAQDEFDKRLGAIKTNGALEKDPVEENPDKQSFVKTILYAIPAIGALAISTTRGLFMKSDNKKDTDKKPGGGFWKGLGKVVTLPLTSPLPTKWKTLNPFRLVGSAFASGLNVLIWAGGAAFILPPVIGMAGAILGTAAAVVAGTAAVVGGGALIVSGFKSKGKAKAEHKAVAQATQQPASPANAPVQGQAPTTPTPIQGQAAAAAAAPAPTTQATTTPAPAPKKAGGWKISLGITTLFAAAVVFVGNLLKPEKTAQAPAPAPAAAKMTIDPSFIALEDVDYKATQLNSAINQNKQVDVIRLLQKYGVDDIRATKGGEELIEKAAKLLKTTVEKLEKTFPTDKGKSTSINLEHSEPKWTSKISSRAQNNTWVTNINEGRATLGANTITSNGI